MNTIDTMQQIALYYACNYCYPLIIKLLLEFSAKPNLQDYYSCTPLLLATITNARDIVAMLLLTKKAAQKILDKKRLMPLIIAAQNSYTRIVKILANYRALASANIEDKYSQIALQYTIKQGSLEIVKILLSNIWNRASILA